MQITFLGAAKTVTGSCYLIETAQAKVLVDCGMFQGGAKEELSNYQPFEFDPRKIDCLLLTHAHIDHSGRVPKLFKEGYNGKVIATKGTKDLCGILLPDSGHIQEFEIEWKNRKRLRAGKEPLEPLYTQKEAEDCLKYFEGIDYNEKVEVAPGISARFLDAGHMLGSSIIEVWVSEGRQTTKITFTGDLGNKDIPILKDPAVLEDTDYLVMESTYGNRLHKDKGNKAERFIDIVKSTIEGGGNVVIPSFAVGRTQEIIYELNKDMNAKDKHMEFLKKIPVFIDSPLAISATEIYRKHPEYYDRETRRYIEKGEYPLDFPNLNFCRTAEESKALNELEINSIIISASGMCEAGRIRHHLKHNLWKENATILFMGYQAPGTLGRRILDGKEKVRLFGEEITVKARIESIDGYSGHADQAGLLEWLGAFKVKPIQIFLVHGEKDSLNTLSGLIKKNFDIKVHIPEHGETAVLYEQAIYKFSKIEERRKTEEFRLLEIINMIETVKDDFDSLEDILKEQLFSIKDDEKLTKLLDSFLCLSNSIKMFKSSIKG